MVNARLGQWLYLFVCVLIVLKTESVQVANTILTCAKEKGAVCLDGSPPAYALHRGLGQGEKSWLIFLEGGGWCVSENDCYTRSKKVIGSSNTWATQDSTFSGILSDKEKDNPYFYNWNRVYIRYCDGSSYVGDREQPYIVNGTHVYSRGARVFHAIIEDLLVKGLKDASNALLSGCSAGGLGAMLQCDNFRSLLPTSTKVKCLADASYFIDATDIYGGRYRCNDFAKAIETHASAKNLPESCTSKMNASLCMFPQYFAPQIRTPLFLVNSAFDFWQIENSLMPKKIETKDLADLYKKYAECKYDIERCTCDQVKSWRGFGEQFHQALSGLSSSPSNGMFINSCSSHCQTQDQSSWLGNEASKLNKVAIGVAVGKWFVCDIPFRKIDHKRKSPEICTYHSDEPNWNNNYTWGGVSIIPNFTLQDEITRKARLVPLCPAEVPVYHRTTKIARREQFGA